MSISKRVVAERHRSDPLKNNRLPAVGVMTLMLRGTHLIRFRPARRPTDAKYQFEEPQPRL